MATAQTISWIENADPQQLSAALGKALSGNESVGEQWASRLLDVAEFRAFIRDFFDAYWCDSPQREDEIGILLGAGTLFAAGMLYAQQQAAVGQDAAR